MSTLLLFLTMLMVMKSEAAPAQIITVSTNSDETILLSPGLRMEIMEPRWDVRWTHLHLVLSLKKNKTTCHHGRCELLNSGSLRFSRVQTQDSGNYSLEVFAENGTRLMRRHFLLQVQSAGISSSAVGASLSIFCLFLFLLMLFITIITLRRRMKKMNTSGPAEENMYVSMISHHGNKGGGETKQEKEEEPVYVPCHPAVSTETPITKRTSAETDVYV